MGRRKEAGGRGGAEKGEGGEGREKEEGREGGEDYATGRAIHGSILIRSTRPAQRDRWTDS